jgi:hypothetical protein
VVHESPRHPTASHGVPQFLAFSAFFAVVYSSLETRNPKKKALWLRRCRFKFSADSPVFSVAPCEIISHTPATDHPPLTTSPSIRTVLPEPLPLAPPKFFSTPLPPTTYKFCPPSETPFPRTFRCRVGRGCHPERNRHQRGPSPMNCPSNLKFNFPAVSLIGVHSCSSVVQILRAIPLRPAVPCVLCVLCGYLSSSVPSILSRPFRHPSPHARKSPQTAKIYGPDFVHKRPIRSKNVQNPPKTVQQRTPLSPPSPSFCPYIDQAATLTSISTQALGRSWTTIRCGL